MWRSKLYPRWRAIARFSPQTGKKADDSSVALRNRTRAIVISRATDIPIKPKQPAQNIDVC
ncbi:uncharacterized protein SCHCODRAFT_02643308 [Schizophyllum commune H4-8]|uniref:uncharacterized protein n=1 Tax=Schizophyllum commune (strain H4-8 / FGSC 9210) TaxID=578458 RepID=UPI00215E40B5|nr:uncharacterized protein SCHCODRAFT_02643308 [Schizophyllum commune H4-8]KAI5886128.1 hypothetical protein SCHCODRAFT_02643308 [Schizophyllum commune H4-8]